MLKTGFQLVGYLTATLTYLTLAYTLESSEIRMLESEYGKRGNQAIYQPGQPPKTNIAAVERRNAKLTDPLIRFGRRYEVPEHIFGRNVRTEAFQKSPLIRFGKRYMMDDGTTGFGHHFLQQEPYFEELNYSGR